MNTPSSCWISVAGPVARSPSAHSAKSLPGGMWRAPSRNSLSASASSAGPAAPRRASSYPNAPAASSRKPFSDSSAGSV
ncbi:hypothetical protein ACFQFR_33060 [Streptomyces goshikiensis]